jgi:hypothetical protein
MMDMVEERLVNGFNGYDTSDVFVTIGYKDGSIKHIEQRGTDFEASVGFKNKSFALQYKEVRSSLRSKDISFATYDDGYGNTRYYAHGANGLNQFKEYGHFDEWKNGKVVSRYK